jgi:hypothetical protein
MEAAQVRFDKDTRTLIHEAAPNSVTIRWPAGAAEPQKGRVYWMQSLEDAEREKERLQYSPPAHRDVMARMHHHFYGTWPKGYKPPKRKGKRRKPDDVILVLDVRMLDRGWEAKVAVYEDPDPVRHTGLKTKVRAGLNPIDGFQEPTEMEPEKILIPLSRSEREESEDVFKFEHEASVDDNKIAEQARKVHNLRRRGKRSTLAEAAVERAKKRAAVLAAD